MEEIQLLTHSAKTSSSRLTIDLSQNPQGKEERRKKGRKEECNPLGAINNFEMLTRQKLAILRNAERRKESSLLRVDE